VANHAQAEKRTRQRNKLQAHNRHYKATMRTFIKRVRTAIDEKDSTKAKECLKAAVPFIDRCAQKGLLPKERASRTISRLTRAVSGL
jgi:small subunit ribosomal protein S20